MSFQYSSLTTVIGYLVKQSSKDFQALCLFQDSYVLGHKTVAADLNGAKAVDEADSFINSIDLNNCILVRKRYFILSFKK